MKRLEKLTKKIQEIIPSFQVEVVQAEAGYNYYMVSFELDGVIQNHKLWTIKGIDPFMAPYLVKAQNNASYYLTENNTNFFIKSHNNGRLYYGMSKKGAIKVSKTVAIKIKEKLQNENLKLLRARKDCNQL